MYLRYRNLQILIFLKQCERIGECLPQNVHRCRGVEDTTVTRIHKENMLTGPPTIYFFYAIVYTHMHIHKIYDTSTYADLCKYNIGEEKLEEHTSE